MNIELVADIVPVIKLALAGVIVTGHLTGEVVADTVQVEIIVKADSAVADVVRRNRATLEFKLLAECLAVGLEYSGQ